MYTKAFDCVNHNKLWKILKEMRTPDHLTCFLRNLYAGQEATVRIGHVLTVRTVRTGHVLTEQTGSKEEEEYVMAVYCHPAYLTYMQSTS